MEPQPIGRSLPPEGFHLPLELPCDLNDPKRQLTWQGSRNSEHALASRVGTRIPAAARAADGKCLCYAISDPRSRTTAGGESEHESARPRYHPLSSTHACWGGGCVHSLTALQKNRMHGEHACRTWVPHP